MKNMKKKFFSSLLLLTLVTLSTSACNFPGFSFSNKSSITPTNTPTLVPTITPRPKATQPIISIDNNSFTITVTEQQANQFANQNSSLIKEPKVQDINIEFREGIISISGRSEQSGILLPFLLEVALKASGSNLPEYQIITAKVGPFDLPESVVDQLTFLLLSKLNEQYLPAAKNIRINEITIANGNLIISGTK